jgi:hypothetical protein
MQREAKETTRSLVKYGNTRGKHIGDDSIGHPMGPIVRELRTEGGGALNLDKDCELYGYRHHLSPDHRLAVRLWSVYGISQFEVL